MPEKQLEKSQKCEMSRMSYFLPCTHFFLQVLLRWNLDRGVAVIPKSTSAAHLADNVAVFGWSLGHKDKALIGSIGNEGTVRYVPVNRELLLHPSNEETFWD